MKILLDENIDPRLKNYIDTTNNKITITSVKDMNWLGMKNGELLSRAVENEFDIFISADKQIKYQQNLLKYGINFILLKLQKNNFSNQISKISVLNSLIEYTRNTGIRIPLSILRKNYPSQQVSSKAHRNLCFP